MKWRAAVSRWLHRELPQCPESDMHVWCIISGIEGAIRHQKRKAGLLKSADTYTGDESDWNEAHTGWRDYTIGLGIDPLELKIIAIHVLDMEKKHGRMGLSRQTAGEN